MSYSRCARFRLIEQKLGSGTTMRPGRSQQSYFSGASLFTVLAAPADSQAQYHTTALLLLRHRAQTTEQAVGEEAHT